MRLAATIIIASLACGYWTPFEAKGQSPEPQRVVAPAYPRLPPGFRESGEVQVDVAIRPSGEVSSAKAVTGPERLRSAAEAAAREWRFKPSSAAVEKWSITFAFIMQRDVNDPPVIASAFVAPNRVEVFAKERQTIAIDDPEVQDVEKARRQKQK